MKARLYILVLLLVIGWSSCTRRTTYPLFMQEAVKCMDNRPDRALELLKYLEDSLPNMPEETQMYYHLLCIQAKDKQYITHTDDSLINCIVEFYENRDDADKKMMAYYYQGSTYRDMNDAPRALKSYQQAVDVSSPDNDLLPKVYNQMGNLFAYQDLYDESIEANRKSMEFYIRQGKSNKISYSLRDFARMHNIKEVTDSASYYYEKACETALAGKDSIRYYEILSEYGGYLYSISQSIEAKRILKSLEHNRYIRNKSHIYFILGYVYNDTQQWDSAFYYNKKVLATGSIDKKYNSYINLAKLEEKKYNKNEALQYLKKAILLNDSIQKITQTEAVAKINSLYNYQHTEAENNQLKIKQKNQSILLLCLIFSILLISGYLLFRIKQKKAYILLQESRLKRIEEEKQTLNKSIIELNKAKLAELNIKLQQSANQNDILKTQLLEIERKKLELQNKQIITANNEQELRINILKQSEIYLFFHRTENSITTENWTALHSAIDTAYPKFTERLQVLYPQISDLECQICWLTKISVPPTRIATHINRSRSAVSNIRARLYKKIHGIAGTSELFCKFIAEF